MAIGVFGLQVAYKLKRTEVMSVDDTHGWFGGGGTPSFVSTVDRIDFSNDTGTANIRNPLSSARGYLAATGNSNYGWFGGGATAGAPFVASATVDRIDFSNDSSTASARGPLSLARGYLAATGNSNYGWFGGGYNPSAPVSKSTVDRIDFSNDSSTASPRGPLSSARYLSAATGNTNYGWFAGGRTPTEVSTVDRIDFSNDSATASPRSSLNAPAGRSSLAATGNSSYGWFGGGAILSRVDRIDFSNDSATASPRGPLSASRQDLAATGNSNYGWFGGGVIPAGYRSTVDRIDFSNDSVSASPRGSLSSARNGLAATSGQAKGPAIKLQKAGNYGWFGGGQTPPSTPVATVDRINFSNDLATASPRGSLSSARYGPGATGNSNYGWFGGGFYTDIVDRVDFSNDSATASVRGPLSFPRGGVSAVGNSNYGWFGGGYNFPLGAPTTKSIVDRINFSNDSTTASVRGPLPSAKTRTAATGNSNYGWIGGSGTPINRIDFSNDSSPLTRGTFFFGRYGAGATGNTNYGWFGGGGFPTLGSVERIDFSNDNITTSLRGPLSLQRSYLTATGNSNYGWFGGGLNPDVPAVYSIVDRINFSNDLSTASPRSLLNAPAGRHQLAATSNTPT